MSTFFSNDRGLKLSSVTKYTGTATNANIVTIPAGKFGYVYVVRLRINDPSSQVAQYTVTSNGTFQLTDLESIDSGQFSNNVASTRATLPLNKIPVVAGDVLSVVATAGAGFAYTFVVELYDTP